MLWEEKIDLLKKRFSLQEFHVHFNDWPAILKKIESRFIVKQNSMYFLRNWRENIKNKHFIQTIIPAMLQNYFGELDKNQTYWFIVLMTDTPTSKQYIYSCSPKVIHAMVPITANDFFIVDKKLAWFTHFHYAGDKIEVYKGGDTETPFDKVDA